MGKKRPLDHPSVDTSDRFPLDALLRDNGWRIVQRWKRGEAIWEKKGIRRRHEEALRTLDANAVADAVMMEEIHYDQYE